MQAAALARFATVHWLKFPEIVTPATLRFGESPQGSLSYKVGPDGPVGAVGRGPLASMSVLA